MAGRRASMGRSWLASKIGGRPRLDGWPQLRICYVLTCSRWPSAPEHGRVATCFDNAVAELWVAT